MRASRDVSERVRVTAARRVRGSASPSLYEAASYEKRSRSPLLPHQKPDARVAAMIVRRRAAAVPPPCRRRAVAVAAPSPSPSPADIEHKRKSGY